MFGHRAFSLAGLAAWTGCQTAYKIHHVSLTAFAVFPVLVFLAYTGHKRLCDHVLYRSTADIDTVALCV